MKTLCNVLEPTDSDSPFSTLTFSLEFSSINEVLLLS